MKYYLTISCLLLLSLSCGPITNNRSDNNSGKNPHLNNPPHNNDYHQGPRSSGNTGSGGSGGGISSGGISKITPPPPWSPPTPSTPQEIAAKTYLDGFLPTINVLPAVNTYWTNRGSLALKDRLLAIAKFKKEFLCYYAYVEERLGKGPSIYLKLEALEKRQYPLVFSDQAQYNSFKAELIAALQAAGFGNALTMENDHIVIVGTASTFFSENPGNGNNMYFNESHPQCVSSAQDASLKTTGAYSFDAKGPNSSDVDIHLFIPLLSKACESAGVSGNSNTRSVYYQNTLGPCFDNATAPALAQAMIDKTKFNWQGAGVGGTRDPFKPPSAMSAFITKWMATLGGREINFSVHVLPSQWVYNTTHGIMGDTHFDNNIYVTHGNFIINIP